VEQWKGGRNGRRTKRGESKRRLIRNTRKDAAEEVVGRYLTCVQRWYFGVLLGQVTRVTELLQRLSVQRFLDGNQKRLSHSTALVPCADTSFYGNSLEWLSFGVTWGGSQAWQRQWNVSPLSKELNVLIHWTRSSVCVGTKRIHSLFLPQECI